MFLVSAVKTSFHNLIYHVCTVVRLLQPVWPDKSRQISVKVAQKWFHYKKGRFWHHYKNCLRMLGDLGKIIVAKGFKKLPKIQKIARSGHTESGPSIIDFT